MPWRASTRREKGAPHTPRATKVATCCHVSLPQYNMFHATEGSMCARRWVNVDMASFATCQKGLRSHESGDMAMTCHFPHVITRFFYYANVALTFIQYGTSTCQHVPCDIDMALANCWRDVLPRVSPINALAYHCSIFAEVSWCIIMCISHMDKSCRAAAPHVPTWQVFDQGRDGLKVWVASYNYLNQL